MKYIVIGASAAGISAVKEIRKNDKTAEIVLVSKDEKIYSRCILHHYLSEHRTVEQLDFSGKDFITKYNVNWIKGQAVTEVSANDKFIILSNNEKITYDKLLVASGARSQFPQIENINLYGNIHGFRNLIDVEAIKQKSKTAKNIVVLGAGLVGMDVVAGLCDSGVKNITVIEFANRVLSKQLDGKSSEKYVKVFEEKGVNFKFGGGVKSVKGDDFKNVKSVVLSDGTEVACDLLIVAIGVTSNVEFLNGSNVEIDKQGVVVDENGRTSVEDIYAAGDVTGKGPIWPVAVKEGIVAGSNMTGNSAKMDDFFYSKSTMSFYGVNTMSIGNIDNVDGCNVEIFEDGDVYKKIIHKDNIIVGAILQGDLSYGGILTQLVSKKINISNVGKSIFKIDYSDFFNIDENSQYYYNE